MRKLLSEMGRDCAAAGRPDGLTVNSPTITRLRFLNLRPHVLLVALRTIAVTELRLGSVFDVALDRFPLFRSIANPFAVRAERQQALGLCDRVAHPADRLCG